MSNKTIKVCLRKGHPKRVMLARLANDEVISIGEGGVTIAPDLVSAEMRGCGWFEGLDGAAAEVVDLRTDTDGHGPAGTDTDNAGGEGGSGEGESDEDPADDQDDDSEELTPAQKAARTRAANKAKKDAAAKK